MSGPSVTVQRAPDGWTHIGGPGMHLLIALDEEDERTLTASDAADGGDLDDVIDVLTTGGMRRAHHFVGVHWEPQTRLVGFGPVAARIVLADGSEREFRPSSPRVWTDLELDEHPESVDLRVVDDSDLPQSRLPESRLPQSSGHHLSVERTEDVTRLGTPSSSSAPEVPRSSSSSAQEVPPSSGEGPSFAGPMADAGRPASTAPWGQSWRRPDRAPETRASAPAEAPTTTPRNQPASYGATLPAWGSGAPLAARRYPAPTEGVPAATEHSTEAGPTTSARSSDTLRPLDGEGGQGGPSYDYLFGHTVTAEEHRRLLAEADRDEPTDDELDSAPPAAALTPDESPARPAQVEATPPPLPAPAAPAAQPAGLISSVPWATRELRPKPEVEPAPAFTGRHSPPPAPPLLPPSEAPEPQPPAAPAVPRPPMVEPTPHTIAAEPDDAELTIDRSALIAARNAALDGGTGPRVMAVLCTSGHPSPPHANRCRVCGQPIPPQEPFEMARPALGILRLSTGDVVTLDRNVLLGRAPKPVDGLAPEEQPHVVKVPSPERDISRNHVEVLIEGWHVLIRDLGTTNGTTVALPGEPPVRLRANDQQSLEPGSDVSMADDVSFTFEVGS